MGLLGPGISEVIATTRGNAAPIGVHSRDGALWAVLYRGSHTAANAERDGWLVANVVHDPVLFVRTAFEDLPAGALVPVPGLGWDRLAAAEGYAACRVEVERSTPEALRVRLAVVREECFEARCLPLNRGRCAVVEAAVHATRYIRSGDLRLARLIEHHGSVVRRCGGPAELEALALLEQYIASARS